MNDISNSRFKYLQQKLDEPILLADTTVIFDSRKQTDYMMYSLPGAIHLTWPQLVADSTIDNSVVTGDKAFYSARRLARLGVDPKSEVVVVGRKEKGQAHAGRLAWSLLTLGFENVQVTSIESLKKSLTPFKERQHKSIPIWKPESNTNLEISAKEFMQTINRSSNDLMVIDVRSDNEMQQMNLKQIKSPRSSFSSVYIPWTYFYTKKGRPHKSFNKRLAANGVNPKQDIIVISNEGVRSGAVAYALMTMGYPRVRNFSGGYKSLFTK